MVVYINFNFEIINIQLLFGVTKNPSVYSVICEVICKFLIVVDNRAVQMFDSTKTLVSFIWLLYLNFARSKIIKNKICVKYNLT